MILPLTFPSLERIDTPEGRFYKTPEGNLYQSITTKLQAISKEGIEKWEKRVGIDEANRIRNIGTVRGNQLHENCERFFNGQELVYRNSIDKIMFMRMKPFLEEVDEVLAIEKSVYSNKLKVAGTFDLLAIKDSKLKLIDFKNSKKNKTKEDVFSYYIQACFYSLALRELGICKPEEFEIWMATPYSSLRFEGKVIDWIQPTIDFLIDGKF